MPPDTWYGRPTDGARVRPTIAGPISGRGCHCRAGWPGPACRPSRPAIEPGTAPGASVTERGTDAHSRRFEGGIPGPDHEPSNRIIGHQARKSVGLAALIGPSPIALRVSGGRSSFSAPFADRDARGLAPRVRRNASLAPVPDPPADPHRARRDRPGRHGLRRRARGRGSRCSPPSRGTTGRMRRSDRACARGTCRTR